MVELRSVLNSLEALYPFTAGRAINWQQIVELYNANEEEILAGVEDNFPHLGANITKDYLEGIDDKDDDIEYIDEKK